MPLSNRGDPLTVVENVAAAYRFALTMAHSREDVTSLITELAASQRVLDAVRLEAIEQRRKMGTPA